MSLQMLTLRILGPRENRECVAFYSRLIILIGSFAAGLMLGFRDMPFDAVILSLASGGFGSFGWLLMAHAYKLAPAALVAPFQYSEIITGALIGYLIWHDVPSAHLAVGAVVIIASGIYIITHARKSAALLKEEKSNA
jgi:drug/metabolite transporter (DMT)-like permease